MAALLLGAPVAAPVDARLTAQIALVRQGVEAYGGVKLSQYAEVGVQASAPWSARSTRDVAVKALFKFKFW